MHLGTGLLRRMVVRLPKYNKGTLKMIQLYLQAHLLHLGVAKGLGEWMRTSFLQCRPNIGGYAV